MNEITDIPVVILAGGLGTRLRHVLQDVPKPMAPIRDRPFLTYILDNIIAQGSRDIILATGHLSELITDYFGDKYLDARIRYSHEHEPLGTGGAIKLVFDRYNLDRAFVLNGDTLFDVKLSHLSYFHEKSSSPISMSIKFMKNFDRYGTVDWDAFNIATAFHEKIPKAEGWINGGVYLLNKELFEKIDASAFSFETNVLETAVTDGQIFCLPSPGYFIDIGIPEDYYQFQKECDDYHFISQEIDAYFVDRDGVINTRIPGDYVRHPDQLELIDRSLEALNLLKSNARYLIVVTNQQGIGKGLMTDEDLRMVHNKLNHEAESLGVHIDAIYHCPHLDQDRPACRKPNVGMGLTAMNTFDHLDPSRCVMIGDSTSDIEFGLRLGMYTILVGDKSDAHIAHERYQSLAHYAFSALSNS